jgi:two-component system NtrC family sensor kinase
MNKLTRLGFKFRSSIYGQVVFTITIMAFVLFISVGAIFRQVNRRYLNTVIRQSGDNIGSIVEGALYHSMLTNDRGALENTLDVINDLPGIEDVNMYDNEDNLVYSTISDNPLEHNNPNCKQCHGEINSVLPGQSQSFKVLKVNTKCEMSQKDYSYRLLFIKSTINNEPSCYTAACHAHNERDKVLGSFVIRIPLEDLDTAIEESSFDFFLLAALATVLLAVFLLFFTRKKINKPLNEIVSASEAVSKGDKSTRLKLETKQLNDMKMVSKAFNEMLDNLQAANDELQTWSQQLEYKVQKKSEELTEIQNELIHVEKIASLGKLSSSVAHEINNPLSGVLTYTKLVHKQLSKIDLEKEEKESMLKYLMIIEDETKRCGDIVKGLLDFSRKDQLELKVHHLHNVLKDTYTLLDHQMKISNITFITDLKAKEDSIKCNDNQIKQACIAILMNASEAISGSGEIIMRTSNPEKGFIRLEIIDNGTGIAQEDQQHVFEPFFSAKDKTNGIGLGLAIVHGIITSHNGKVELKSEVGKGTTIIITLPLVR